MKLKVYAENNSFVGVLARTGVRGAKYRIVNDPKKQAFRKYYREALSLKISKREISDFLFNKMLNDEKSYLVDKDEIAELIKKEANRLHQKVKRYKRKFGFFRPNYFVTFTYADDIIDEESFERKLRRALSNLAYRNDWRYIGVRERGAEGDRVHFHFLVHVPAGKMIGELYLDSQWSTKRKKREYFTNNTYFQERFGKCQFEAITGEQILDGSIQNYLLKYLIKDDEKLIYSRHIPTEIEVDVDMENDVFLTFYDFSIKVYLSLNIFFNEKELELFGESDFIIEDPEGMGYDPEVRYIRRLA